MDSDQIYGTAEAPLAASVNYSFRRATSADGLASLMIPFVQRGSWDDFGVVERREQDVWLTRFAATMGAPGQGKYPGEFTWSDAATRDRVWDALRAALREPVKAPPSGTVERSVRPGEARAVSEGLTRRFCELAAAVGGCDATRFERFHCEVTGDDFEPQRKENWKCDDGTFQIYVSVVAKGLGSGVGIHGEETSFTLDTIFSDERAASAYARIDLRTGGVISVTVTGVIDAQRLAHAFAD